MKPPGSGNDMLQPRELLTHLQAPSAAGNLLTSRVSTSFSGRTMSHVVEMTVTGDKIEGCRIF
jgi:hypothetical protein